MPLYEYKCTKCSKHIEVRENYTKSIQHKHCNKFMVRVVNSVMFTGDKRLKAQTITSERIQKEKFASLSLTDKCAIDNEAKQQRLNSDISTYTKKTKWELIRGIILKLF